MSKNNKSIQSQYNDKKKITSNQLLENVKSKYVLANTIKANKISTKLSKSLNNVISDKNFIGYDENDYEDVEKMCKINNVNLFVKNKSTFFNDVSCENNLYIKSKNVVGYSDTEYSDLNNDTTLHVKGDSEINGNLFVYQNINSDKNINVQQCINIGFENESLDNTSKLNVNGNSEFVGDNVVYGSEYIKNNLVVNEKAHFYNEILTSNSLCLKKEFINNVVIVNNIISENNYKILLNNILSSIQNNDQSESSIIKFYSKKNKNICSGLISASKKFIIGHDPTLTNQTEINPDNQLSNKISGFILVYGIYSNSKIISIKPILDTFILIDSNDNVVKIDNVSTSIYSPVQSNYSTQNFDKIKEEENIPHKNTILIMENISHPIINTHTDTSFISTSLDLLKNNKLTNLFKINIGTTNNSGNIDPLIECKNIKNDNLKVKSNQLIESSKIFNKLQNKSEKTISSVKSISSDLSDKSGLSVKSDSSIKSSNSKLSAGSDFTINSYDSEQIINNDNIKKTKYQKNKKSFFDIDSNVDLEAFEIIK